MMSPYLSYAAFFISGADIPVIQYSVLKEKRNARKCKKNSSSYWWRGNLYIPQRLLKGFIKRYSLHELLIKRIMAGKMSGGKLNWILFADLPTDDCLAGVQ